MKASRREFFGSVGALGLAATGLPVAAAAPAVDEGELQAILEKYAGFGIKASGGTGDIATGRWLEQELTKVGYRCRHQTFDVPFFEQSNASFTVGDTTADVIPQAPVLVTDRRGLTAPVRLADRTDDLTGAIALIDLPFKRWASLATPQAAQPLADALKRGAAAAVLITNGPTGEAIALNVTAHRAVFDRPVAILAPKDAGPFLTAARQGATATLILDGAGGAASRRQASNLIARLDRGHGQTMVISTPRSGWFTCAAERGSGIAIWLSLARWLATSDHGVNVELLATSGHEYEFLGGEHYLAEAAPKPATTRLWVHIGASAAARDWHELGPRLLPLPSADSQRVLTATADVLASTRNAFSGVSGLEATYLADKTTAGGELVNVLAARYPTSIGLYGGHRYFHTQSDDLRCSSGLLVRPVEAAFRDAINKALRPGT